MGRMEERMGCTNIIWKIQYLPPGGWHLWPQSFLQGVPQRDIPPGSPIHGKRVWRGLHHTPSIPNLPQLLPKDWYSLLSLSFLTEKYRLRLPWVEYKDIPGRVHRGIGHWDGEVWCVLGCGHGLLPDWRLSPIYRSLYDYGFLPGSMLRTKLPFFEDKNPHQFDSLHTSP